MTRHDLLAVARSFSLWLLVVVALLALLLWLVGGCEAFAAKAPAVDSQQLAAAVATAVKADVSAAAPAVDSQQVAGAVAAAVKADVSAIGYQSQFGLGATLVVGLALVLTLVLSHRREMARIKMNGSAP